MSGSFYIVFILGCFNEVVYDLVHVLWIGPDGYHVPPFLLLEWLCRLIPFNCWGYEYDLLEYVAVVGLKTKLVIRFDFPQPDPIMNNILGMAWVVRD